MRWIFLRKILYLPEQASTASLKIDHLHFFVILTTIVASVLVGLTAVYFFIKYRRRSEYQKTPFIEAPWWMEAIIITVPAIFFLWWFARGFSDLVFIQSPPPNTFDVYVMSKQWMWKYSYPNGPNSIDRLHVPAFRPVRLLLTSRDVIHSFFVPAFRLKQDAVPGRYTEMWFEARMPGTYQVLCAEYCGTNHSMMWGDVVVMEPVEFENWFAKQRRGLGIRQDESPAPREEGVESLLVQQGWKVAAEQGCLRCHTTDGTPHLGPSFQGMYGRQQKMITGRTIVIDEAYITQSMMDPMAEIVAGYQPIMPSYRGVITPTETAAIVELIKSLRTPGAISEPAGGPAYELQPSR